MEYRDWFDNEFLRLTGKSAGMGYEEVHMYRQKGMTTFIKMFANFHIDKKTLIITRNSESAKDLAARMQNPANSVTVISESTIAQHIGSAYDFIIADCCTTKSFVTMDSKTNIHILRSMMTKDSPPVVNYLTI